MAVGFGQQAADHHGSLTAIVLKGHPSSRGTVTLTGSDPQDPLNIQKNHFQATDGPRDVATMRDGIKKAREVIQQLPIWIFVDEEVFPGKQASSDEEIEEHIYEHVFGLSNWSLYKSGEGLMIGKKTGHHACCTNAIGPDGGESLHISLFQRH